MKFSHIHLCKEPIIIITSKVEKAQIFTGQHGANVGQRTMINNRNEKRKSYLKWIKYDLFYIFIQ